MTNPTYGVPLSNSPGIDILNCGLGHNEIQLDAADPAGMESAKWMIIDMLKRGYSLFVKDSDGKLTRVESFDSKHLAYVIGEGPKTKQRGRPKETKREVPITSVRATAIGRTSGG